MHCGRLWVLTGPCPLILTFICWVPRTCMFSCSVMSDSCDPMDWSPVHGIFPGKNTGVGCHFLLQGIFLTQILNLCLLHLLHWQVDSLPLSHLGSPNQVLAEEIKLNPHLMKKTNLLHYVILSFHPVNTVYLSPSPGSKYVLHENHYNAPEGYFLWFIHSLMQQIFTEQLLHVKHCVGWWPK